MLLYKSNHYGIRGIRNKWFVSYISNHKQYIEINKSKSSLKSITNRVPQGSILGPVIFLVYINDIINSTSLNLLSFTDDTPIYQSGSHIDDLINNMNHELKKFMIGANKLSVNVKKNFFCIFSPVNTISNVNNRSKINNDINNQVGQNNKEESVKFLGLHLDNTTFL